jgi:hypothetical protein
MLLVLVESKRAEAVSALKISCGSARAKNHANAVYTKQRDRHQLWTRYLRTNEHVSCQSSEASEFRFGCFVLAALAALTAYGNAGI